jgi:CobQ/CobB/MinD/ParA nucleotide binding domain/CobB/CobQ-like glutamine amidotransferase domain
VDPGPAGDRVGVIPRLVIAGTSSGVGKTTVATGLLAALRARGIKPAGSRSGRTSSIPATTRSRPDAQAAEIAALARAGRPVLAECGGLLYLCTPLDGHPMSDVIVAHATMTRPPDAGLPGGDRHGRPSGLARRRSQDPGSRVPLLPRRPARRRDRGLAPGSRRRRRGGPRGRRGPRLLPAHALGRDPGRRAAAGGDRGYLRTASISPVASASATAPIATAPTINASWARA